MSLAPLLMVYIFLSVFIVRVCSSVSNFNNRNQCLITKLQKLQISGCLINSPLA